MNATAKRTASGAKTLPGQYYTSGAIFHEELDRLFSRHWLCVGHISQLPSAGSYFLRNVCGESLIVTRDRNAQVLVFYNVCRHRGTRLCTEAGGQFAGKIQCPYHVWTFALNGQLIGAPNMKDTEGFQMSNYPLHSVPSVVSSGFIFINLSAQPEPFEETLAQFLQKFERWEMTDLMVDHTVIYDIQANWKLIFQNYSECYHCPKVHPALSQLTPYRSSQNHFEEGPVLGGPMAMTVGVQSVTLDGRSCAIPFASLSEEDLNVVHYYTIFPSMFLTLNPDYVLVHRIEPQSTYQTRVTCDWLFHRDATQHPDFDPERAIELWDLTNRQDWHVCELSQQGVSSRAYIPGPYADLESLLAAFDREYLRAMNR